MRTQIYGIFKYLTRQYISYSFLLVITKFGFFSLLCHILEIIFLTPDDFDGGGIDNVLRVSLKRSEQDTGNPLLGIPAKIADGFFLVALSDSTADTETNMLLLRRQSWIDIPVVYKSGRRALITIEKGIPGDKVFNDVLNAWQAATSG